MSTNHVVDLSKVPGDRSVWGRPFLIVALWNLVEVIVVSNPLQPSSRLRILALRAFGAEIGEGVVFRPRTRVKFPWKLKIGDLSWIGEGVWFHNQDFVYVGNNSVVSQETFITTGSHRHRVDMALITRPVTIGDGAWITSRCVILGGTVVGQSALIRPLSLVDGIAIPAAEVWGGNPVRKVEDRFSAGVSDE